MKFSGHNNGLNAFRLNIQPELILLARIEKLVPEAPCTKSATSMVLRSISHVEWHGEEGAIIQESQKKLSHNIMQPPCRSAMSEAQSSTPGS
jgi:hypothetical protein